MTTDAHRPMDNSPGNPSPVSPTVEVQGRLEVGPKRILALDPANRTGWAWSDGKELEYHVRDITARKGGHIGDRLDMLDRLISEVVTRRGGVDLIAAEDSCLGSGQRNNHTATMHAELRGVIRMAAYRLGVPCVEYAPISVKAFAGCAGKKTRKDKTAIVRACHRLLGIETDDDNVADALFILEMAKQGYKPTRKPKKRRSRKKGPQGSLFK